jgi:hypothetical protein
MKPTERWFFSPSILRCRLQSWTTTSNLLMIGNALHKILEVRNPSKEVRGVVLFLRLISRQK